MTSPVSVDSAWVNGREAMLKSCEEFYQSCPPPKDLSIVKGMVGEFVERHQKENRTVVLVTVRACCSYGLHVTIAPTSANHVFPVRWDHRTLGEEDCSIH